MSFTLDFSTFWWEQLNWEADDRFQKLSTAIVRAVNQLINQTKDNQLAEKLKKTTLHFDQYLQTHESVDPFEFFTQLENLEEVCKSWDIDILFTKQVEEASV